MHPLLLVVFLLVVVASLAGMVRLYLRERWVRRLAAMARIETNRNRFGALRTKLMAMARQEEVDVRSEVFATVYATLTELMRRPQNHQEAVKRILALPVPQEPEVAFEGRQLSDAEVGLLLEMAGLLDLLCRDFNLLYRLVAWFGDRAKKGSYAEGIPFLTLMFEQKSRMTRSPERNVHSTKAAGEKLASIGQAGRWPVATREIQATAHS